MTFDTLNLSDDSIDVISAAYEAQHGDSIHVLMTAYAYKIERRIAYKWKGGSIEHPISGEEYRFWRCIVDALYKCTTVLQHLEKGMLGDWCTSCKYGTEYHAIGLKRGAELLGLV